MPRAGVTAYVGKRLNAIFIEQREKFIQRMGRMTDRPNGQFGCHDRCQCLGARSTEHDIVPGNTVI